MSEWEPIDDAARNGEPIHAALDFRDGCPIEQAIIRYDPPDKEEEFGMVWRYEFDGNLPNKRIRFDIPVAYMPYKPFPPTQGDR